MVGSWFSGWSSRYHAVAAALFVCTASQTLHSEDVAVPNPGAPEGVSAPTNGSKSVAPGSGDDTNQTLPHWSKGGPRPFISGRIIGGIGVGRIVFDAGYGKPHWIWGGLEAAGTIMLTSEAVQSGLHLSAAIVDFSVSVRRTRSFKYGFIAEADSVGTNELEHAGLDRASYDSIDTSLWGVIPYHSLLLPWELTYVKPLGLPSEDLFFEEGQRVVVTRHGVMASKLGLMASPLRSRGLYVGAFSELLSLLGRNDPLVFRVGPSAWARLTNHTDLGLCVTWPVHSADQLGLWASAYGTIALIYRFATGDPQSHFP